MTESSYRRLSVADDVSIYFDPSGQVALPKHMILPAPLDFCFSTIGLALLYLAFKYVLAVRQLRRRLTGG